jgi:hypothetical protein
MNALLDRLHADQIQAIVLGLIGGIVAIVLIIALTKYHLQLLVEEWALKREKQDAELAIKKSIIDRAAAGGASLEALLAAESNLSKASATSEDWDARIARSLGVLDISPREIEDSLARALALDVNRKKAIVEAIDKLVAEGAEHESILAVVRGLSTSTTVTDEDEAREVPVAAVAD